jgi:hypothetical protein
LTFNHINQGAQETTMKYTPKTLDGETQVEIEDGIPVTAKTVADRAFYLAGRKLGLGRSYQW